MTMTPTKPTPSECRLYRRVKGNSRCLRTWQHCVLDCKYNDYCPNYQPKDAKDGK